jgi:hypothetical protein
MTTPVAIPPNATYRLTGELQEPVQSESVRHPAPGDVEFEDLLLRKLGARGWGRVYHFRHYYGLGWGAKPGKPLSPRAVEAFRRFLQEASFPKGRQPSVFLTDRGGLELCWEDEKNKSVQVEFTSQGIEFYQEATDQDGFFGFDRIPNLAQRLANI